MFAGMSTAWTLDAVTALYRTPLLELVYRAATVHRQHHNPNEVQISTLVNIKSGGCPEDCAYCPQAARYHTGVDSEALLSVEQVTTAAKRAKALGSSRLCMGAAWRNVENNADFDHVLDLVRAVNKEDLEVCCTLGMLTEEQAERLSRAGLYAYNHNVDTSEEYYEEIISTRTYEDRIATLGNARRAGITLCSGGIIGMGESVEDRCKMLLTLTQFDPPVESVPINALVAVAGTPLEDQEPIPIWDMIRMVATTRIVLPETTIRLSAGRTTMSREGQAFCFLAGAGSIFAGDQLLTTPNPDVFDDLLMFRELGLDTVAPYAKHPRRAISDDLETTSTDKVRWQRPQHRIAANVAKSREAVIKRKSEGGV